MNCETFANRHLSMSGTSLDLRVHDVLIQTLNRTLDSLRDKSGALILKRQLGNMTDARNFTDTTDCGTS